MHKLIYRLIAIFLLLGHTSAILGALPELKPDKMTTDPAAIAAHNALVARATQRYTGTNDEKVIGRYSSSDGYGNVWELSLIMLGYWDDLFASTDANDHWPEHYGKVMLTATCSMMEEFTCYRENRQLQYLMFWPTRQALLDLGLKESRLNELFGAEGAPNSLVPLSGLTPDVTIFDDIVNEFTVPECSLSSTGNPQPGRFHTRYTKNSQGKYTWCMLQSATLMPESDQYYYQQPGFGTIKIIDTENEMMGGPTQYTSVKFIKHNGIVDSIPIKGGMTRTWEGKSVWSYEVKYKGDYINMLGEVSDMERSFDIGEVHIINTGMCSSDSWTTYKSDFGPLTRYYLLACNPELTFPAGNFTTSSFERTPEPIKTNVNRYDWIQGALYSPANSDKPYGVWREIAIDWMYDDEDATEPIITDAPQANTCIAPEFTLSNELYPWSEEDGLWLMVNGYNSYYPVVNRQEDKPFVMSGTQYGFGVYGTDRYTTPLRLHFDGDIIYHYNPWDYSMTTLIGSVGDVVPPYEWDNGAGIGSIAGSGNRSKSFDVITGNGTITVRAITAKEISVTRADGTPTGNYRPGDGESVTLETGSGMYIVRDVKGSYSTKVMVK